MKIGILTGAMAVVMLFGVCHLPKAQENKMNKETVFPQIFPQGEKNSPANSPYFIGRSYLASADAQQGEKSEAF